MKLKIVDNAVRWLHRWRRKLATGGIGLLACMLALHVVFGANGMLAYHKKRTEFREVQQQNEALKQENGRLSTQIKALKTDPKAIEKEAREQFRYARPGEVVFVLDQPTGTKKSAPQAAEKKP